MAKLYGALRGSQLASAIAGDGIEWASDDILGLDLKANSGLEISATELAVKLDGSTLAMGASGLKVSAISNTEISADAGIALDKIHDMADTKIMIGSGSGNAEYALSGDITMSNAGLIAIGATKVTDSMINDDVATGLAGDGLSASSGVLALDLNELTGAIVVVADDSIAFIDATDNSSKKESIADLVGLIAGTGLTATAGVLSVDTIANNIVEGDIQKEDESANCNGSQVEFTLASTPIANSVMVFLNGQLQIEGLGKNYSISSTTITFATAPLTDDTLIVHYIIDN